MFLRSLSNFERSLPTWLFWTLAIIGLFFWPLLIACIGMKVATICVAEEDIRRIKEGEVKVVDGQLKRVE
jgi:hypothetical protein